MAPIGQKHRRVHECRFDDRGCSSLLPCLGVEKWDGVAFFFRKELLRSYRQPSSVAALKKCASAKPLSRPCARVPCHSTSSRRGRRPLTIPLAPPQSSVRMPRLERPGGWRAGGRTPRAPLRCAPAFAQARRASRRTVRLPSLRSSHKQVFTRLAPPAPQNKGGNGYETGKRDDGTWPLPWRPTWSTS
jgi:hypothetical protein